MLKYLNSLTNNNLTAKEEAEQILKFMLLKNSTIQSIEVWEALEIAMECEMKKQQNEANFLSRAINSKWQTSTKVYDPNFDLPVKKMEVEFEIVKPN